MGTGFSGISPYTFALAVYNGDLYAGGYFTLSSQKNLQMAIAIFNKQYNTASIGIGIGNQSAGLVYKF